jgi:mRNA interferase MazF
VAAVLTTNLALAGAPGNVLIPEGDSGLARDSVANVSQLITVDKTFLTERVGNLTPRLMVQVEHGLRLALSL